MRKEELIRKAYVKPNARLVEFNYRDIVMASGNMNIEDDLNPDDEDDAPTGDDNNVDM